MGKEKYQKKIEDLFNKSPVVNASSISRIIRSKKQVKQYGKQLIRNLILKGKIRRLTKGFYTKYEDPSLVVFCFNGYLGLQDALSIYNLWEQETIPVIITAKKVRIGLRKVLDTNVLIKRIDKKYFFGFDYVKYGDFYLPVSDIEKTFIDFFYFNQKLDKDLIKNFKKKLDKKNLEKYFRKYPKKIKEKVLRKIK